MTNIRTIVGGTGWALVSLLLACAALEPASVKGTAGASLFATAEQAPGLFA